MIADIEANITQRGLPSMCVIQTSIIDVKHISLYAISLSKRKEYNNND